MVRFSSTHAEVDWRLWSLEYESEWSTCEVIKWKIVQDSANDSLLFPTVYPFNKLATWGLLIPFVF